MINIQYIYSGDQFDQDREKVISNLIMISSSLIELPPNIEVQFTKLNPSVYGEVNTEFRFRNRIFLNETLTAKECIKPTLHELLHLNQIHIGRLSGRKGFVIWDGKVYTKPVNTNPEVWANLPWERDVAEKQQKLLENVLKIGLS